MLNASKRERCSSTARFCSSTRSSGVISFVVGTYSDVNGVMIPCRTPRSTIAARPVASSIIW